MLSQVPIFKVRINYKSGHSEEMEVLEFDFTSGSEGRKVNWKQPEGTVIRPLFVNVSDIESVWQVGVRDG
jgi:hypothetical protein